MKKALLYILAVILLCGVTASCSKNDDDNGKKESDTTNKTIFIFMPYADNLTTGDYLLNDIAEMKQGILANGSMTGYRVLVSYGTSCFNSTLYELKLKDGQVVNDTIKTFSDIVQNDEQYLTQLFNMVKTQAPSKTYTLVIGCHGSGWTQRDVNWANVSRSKAVTPRKSFGGYVNMLERIEVATLSKAMTTSSLHTDLILFDCCHMANIETFYDVRNNSDYVIASAGEQPGYGMPYVKLWNSIISNMNRTTVSNILAGAQAYYDEPANQYQHISSDTKKEVNPLSLTGIECSEIDNVAAAMAQLNKKYGECDTDLTNIVQRYDKKEVAVLFDILGYAQYQTGGTTNSYYESVASAVKSAVVSKACQGYYNTIIYGSEINCWPVPNYSGMTISDPTTNSLCVEKKKLTNWWKATHD